MKFMEMFLKYFYLFMQYSQFKEEIMDLKIVK